MQGHQNAPGSKKLLWAGRIMSAIVVTQRSGCAMVRENERGT
jgi:hypothetical protein